MTADKRSAKLDDLQRQHAESQATIERETKSSKSLSDQIRKLAAEIQKDFLAAYASYGLTTGDLQENVYVNPDDPYGKKWNGVGPVPRWLKALEKQGHKREEYLQR